MPPPLGREAARISQEYARRGREIPDDYYALARPAMLYAHQQRSRAVLGMLGRHKLLPLAGRRILDVGCGRGEWLLDLLRWGAHADQLSGIDLSPDRVDEFRAIVPAADVRVGNAAVLPWPDGHFDIALQSTVFTSILDPAMKRAVAAEMLRVLRPGGVVLWYDFFLNNPRNRAVRGVPESEIRQLFLGCHVALERTALAPPLSRAIAPWGWLLAMGLEQLGVLNTHYVGIIRKPG